MGDICCHYWQLILVIIVIIIIIIIIIIVIIIIVIIIIIIFSFHIFCTMHPVCLELHPVKLESMISVSCVSVPSADLIGDNQANFSLELNR